MIEIHRTRLLGEPAAEGELFRISIDRGVIESITPEDQSNQAHRSGTIVIDARGRVVLPGFIDAHTHACWAGDRLDEWDLKRQGVSYLDILKRGGGIMSTVRAVRAASQEQLTFLLLARLNHALEEGTTTIEVKSGYGLTTQDELKMLRAMTDAAASFRGTVVPTALIGHAIDPAQPDFIETTIRQTLPAVHEEFPGITIDAYCEQGAWSLEDCRRLFESALELGHPVRMHTDQFNCLGMTSWAIDQAVNHKDNLVRSVDHLEATAPEILEAIARSPLFAVALPCSGFHVDGRYMNARRLLDAGGKLVIATNCNPGSAPTSSMPMAIALAARHLGLSATEAITACTSSAASLLGLRDRGHIRVGARADLILLSHSDHRQLAYEFGGDPVDAVIVNGEIIKSRM